MKTPATPEGMTSAAQRSIILNQRLAYFQAASSATAVFSNVQGGKDAFT